jgi:hypothetical protein
MTDRPDPTVEPPQSLSGPTDLLLAYLDWYRATAVRKTGGLDDDQLRSSRLPSGWTPIELLNHLAFMERRWIQWGWGGLDLSDLWGDNRKGDDPWDSEPDPEDRWHVGKQTSWDEVVGRLRAAGQATTELVAGRDLLEQAPPGPRFDPDSPPPTLGWILIHVLQEYARHVGHLDTVRELLDGELGE